MAHHAATCCLFWASLFKSLETRRNGTLCVVRCARPKAEEDDNGKDGDHGTEDLISPQGSKAWRINEQGQSSRDHDNRVETGPLPIAATQVKPHAKLIECQSQAGCISYGGNAERPTNRPDEKEVSADNREEKDAVVEVVDVCAADMQKQVGQVASHDAIDQNARCHERKQEGEKHDAGGGSGVLRPGHKSG